MEEIYYIDRPSVPATRQVVVHLDAILEQSIAIDALDINDSYIGRAVEVKRDDETIWGTLVYFPGLSYEELVSTEAADEELDEEEEAEATADDGVVAGDSMTLDRIRAERLLNLELELSAAKQLVQGLEDEIADEEGDVA